MKLYINNATNSLVTSTTLATAPSITLFKEDISSVEIRFVENGSVVDIGTPTIRLALGKDGGLIALTDSWTKNGTGTTAYWTGNFNLNTQQAEMVLAGLSSTEAILEVEVRQGASVATKAQISVTLKTDLINETDTATDIGNIVSVGGDHIASTTNVHGITNTANLVLTNDARLADTRDPKTHTHTISDVTGLQTAIDNSGIKAGVQWTTRHTNSTGNPYLVGSIVYHNGRVYRCIAENDSIPPQQGGNPYWADLGVGYLLPNENPLIVGGSINTSTFVYSDETAGVVLGTGQFIPLDSTFNNKPRYIDASELRIIFAGGSWLLDSEGEIIATAVAGDEPYPWLATWPSGTSVSKQSGYSGGNINANGGATGVGGSIDTSNGGGSIDTRGVGWIQLGATGTRTSLNGSASGSDKTITLPNANGTIALASDLDAKQPLAGVEWTANHTATNPYLVGSIVFYNHNESGVTISGLTGSQAEYNGHYLFISRISGLALYRTSTGQTITQTGIYNGAGYLAGQFIWRLDGLGFQKWGPTPWGQGWGSIPAQNAVETPSQGRVYKCIAQDSSRQPPAVGGNTFWQELGFGFLLPSENPKIVAGTINTQTVGNNVGGTIDTSNAGGSISTSGGGGSINTAGSGSIQFGVSGQRTTLVGSASVDMTPHNHTITLPRATGTIALQNSFTIAVPNVDIGKTVASNPLGWSQQVTIPANISELTGGLPCILDSVAIRITNRLGTGQIHASSTITGGLRVGSQSVLALTPVSGVGTYNADNYFPTLQTGTRPWVGGFTKGYSSGGTFGRSLYTGGDLFINSPIVSGTFRTAYWDATLTEAMDATQTDLAQTVITGGAPSFEGSYLKIDNEVVLITAWLAATASRPTILRAQLGTTATTHAVGAPITTNLGSALGGGILATVYLNFIRVG